jgi:hypothetical protein
MRQERSPEQDETLCLRLAQALVLAKVEGQHRYVLRATRGGLETRQDLLLGPGVSVNIPFVDGHSG